MDVCRLFCGAQVGTLWPYPTGLVQVGNSLVRFDITKVTFDTSTLKGAPRYTAEHAILLDRIEKKNLHGTAFKGVGSAIRIEFDLAEVNSAFDLNSDSSYKLKIAKTKDDVNVLITAENDFGMRNALTTLSQLIVYDDIRREMLVSCKEDPSKKALQMN